MEEKDKAQQQEVAEQEAPQQEVATEAAQVQQEAAKSEAPKPEEAPQQEAPKPEQAPKEEPKVEVEATREQVTALAAQLVKLQAQNDELTTLAQKQQAEFANYKRRTKEEKEQLSNFVTADVVGKFLKVLDNFERAESSMAQVQDVATMQKGIEQIRRQFDAVLKELKVTEIAAQGAEFDPKLHEAVMRGANSEQQDDTIDLVLAKGYQMGELVIRPSKVRVVHND